MHDPCLTQERKKRHDGVLSHVGHTYVAVPYPHQPQPLGRVRHRCRRTGVRFGHGPRTAGDRALQETPVFPVFWVPSCGPIGLTTLSL